MSITRIPAAKQRLPSALPKPSSGSSRFATTLRQAMAHAPAGAGRGPQASQPAVPAAGESGGQPIAGSPASHGSAAPIPLGVIGPDTPTVSHILTRNPHYKAKAWEIIFSPLNRSKPYASLPDGSRIALDPRTRELVISLPTTAKGAPQLPQLATGQPPAVGRSTTAKAGMSKPPPAPPAKPAGGGPALAGPAESPGPAGQPGFGERLVRAVKSYIGVPYSALDCYTLVVRGLEDLGVAYHGESGLRRQLENLAQTEGRPPNAHLNGEGLIEAAGTSLYDATFTHIQNAEQQAEVVSRELQPLLHEGMLLSFSTPTKGHTGVIGKKDGRWTYINSGVIDHQVDGGISSRRVGEESLVDEIKNWFALAQGRSTSLKVSVGLFDTAKLPKPATVVTSRPPGRKEGDPVS